ncbi:MAG: GNAT family N-acetyltransferase [Limnohabitans sp.]|nr:GNAT family N-acetyltransferase [Limnohabitans sp.]MDI9311189.1 GNAT family N-acetyltransferase [Limnohabitans sp.]
MFKENIILENEEVLLRPLHRNDLENLKHFVINEPEIWKFSLVQIATVEQLEDYINKAVEARELEKEYPFIVFDKVKKEYAGCTRYYDIQLAYKYLQLGYTWYGKTFQGTKLNKNCKLLLLEYAFEILGMERVEFRADNRNERSKVAMKSIGCVVEGIFRNHLPTIEGGRRDSIVLSILKEEWEKKVKENLIQKINSR